MRVTLGGIELRPLEKPDTVQLGGDQFLAIRKFPGGKRSIQNMGPDYRPISWSGFFVGKDAYTRMIRIGNLRTAGKPIQFTTELFSFPVVIKEFYPEVKTGQRIPFTITLERHITQKTYVKTDAVDRAAQAIASAAKSTQATITKSVKTHVVKHGENLSVIANIYRSDPDKWPDIYNDPRNKKTLAGGPHDLKPGMVIYV